jgi:hypothetical protein
VSFKYWEKGGLEVSLTFFGVYLIGIMYTLDFEKIAPEKLCPEDWRDEIENGILLPWSISTS